MASLASRQLNMMCTQPSRYVRGARHFVLRGVLHGFGLAIFVLIHSQTTICVQPCVTDHACVCIACSC